MVAVKLGDYKAAKLLIDCGANPFLSPFRLNQHFPLFPLL